MPTYARIAAVMLIVLAALSARAQDAVAPSDFALTIYSTADPAHFDPQTAAQNAMDPNATDNQPLPGYGVVREVRKINLAAGENMLPFADVAAGIDPTTVAFKSLTAPDTTTVLEQNYEFDLVSPDKLLQKYVGKEIIINRKQAPLPDDKTHQPETIQGKLLSYDAQTYVIQTDNKRLPVQMVPRSQDISEIKLFELETGLITKPTLLWKIQAAKAGAHDVQVTYQTDGLTWRADYNLVINKDNTAADLSAWVSILNQSGISYPNAKLKLVAGDVQRMEHERPALLGSGGAPPGLSLAAAPRGFTEKSLFEYHLYTLGRPASLANNSTKQIELFAPRAGIPVQKIYVYYGVPYFGWYNNPNPITDRVLGTPTNTKVDIYLQIDNTQKNGLGIALPAGRVRVYKKDEADAANEFIGEDVIQHTPQDEKIRIGVGSAFDIVGERRQTDFQQDNPNEIRESFEIVLRNHKKEAAHVLIKENLYRWEKWEITAKSDDFEKVDARTIHFPVDVPAGGEKKVTYTVKYTW